MKELKTCKSVTWALRRRRCPVPRLLESGNRDSQLFLPRVGRPTSQACAKKTDERSTGAHHGGGHQRPRGERMPSSRRFVNAMRSSNGEAEATACERAFLFLFILREGHAAKTDLPARLAMRCASRSARASSSCTAGSSCSSAKCSSAYARHRLERFWK